MSVNPFTPYTRPDHPIGPVKYLPWSGSEAALPFGAMSSYELEATSKENQDDYLHVTCGAIFEGEIEPTVDGGAFRALAYGHIAGRGPVKWTDQTIDYRFKYDAPGAVGVNPGFKAFVRYQSEDDLYVASWRFDGVVQIQRKQAGVYTTLCMAKTGFAPPSPGAWHRLRFSAIGDRLELVIDGQYAMWASDQTFAWGTVGIRTDATPGAVIDDWRVM